MTSRTICVYKGCTNSPFKTPYLTFHRFPIDLRVDDWIERCGNEYLMHLSPQQVRNKRLCSAHFAVGDYVGGYRKLLKPGALPIAYDHYADSSVNEDSSNAKSVVCTMKPNSPSPQETIVFLPQEQKNNSPATVFTSHKNATEKIRTRIVAQDQDDPNFDLPSLFSKTSVSLENFDHSSCMKYIKDLKCKTASLQRRLKIAKNKIKSLKKSQARRITVDSVLEDASKFLQEDQIEFLRMQLIHSDKKRVAWTTSEHTFAASLYCVSPKAYNFLRTTKHFALPCLNSLRDWIRRLEEVELSDGLNDNVLNDGLNDNGSNDGLNDNGSNDGLNDNLISDIKCEIIE